MAQFTIHFKDISVYEADSGLVVQCNKPGMVALVVAQYEPTQGDYTYETTVYKPFVNKLVRSGFVQVGIKQMTDAELEMFNLLKLSSEQLHGFMMFFSDFFVSPEVE